MRVSLIRGLGAAALVLNVTVATMLVTVAPAQAIPGLIHMSDISPTNSSTTKELTVWCPDGTTVIGGGGRVSGNGEVFLTGIRPVFGFSASGYYARATEDETGYAGDWYLLTYAICAPAPAGLEYKLATSEPSSASSQGVSAACTAGKKVLGTGAAIYGGGKEVGLSHVLPTPAALTHVAAVAHEDETGYNGTWSVSAWAICANPLPRHEWVVATPTKARYVAEAWCPAGTQVHGVGGYLNGGWGEVRLTGVYPWLLAGGYIVGREDETGYAGNWHPVAVIICAG